MECPRCNAPTADETLREFGGVCPKCLLDFTAEKDAPAFPNLEIVETLGEGGMGVVYKATQKHLGRTVALKVLSPQLAADPQFLERFTREARALAQLSHPHIVGIHDSGVHDGVPYLIMEYVEGTSLRKMLASKKLTPERALEVVPQICDALHYAHARGVVHRDVKPENILIDRDGRVKIADFGLAKLAGTDETRITRSNVMMGTPNYMAPEQIENPSKVDHRADIYSLGVIFYEMLTGELPLGRFKAPSEKAAVDLRLDPVVLKSLEKEPGDRYQRVSELKDDVSRVKEPSRSRPQFWEVRDSPPFPVSEVAVRREISFPRLLTQVALLALAAAGLLIALTHTSGSSATGNKQTEWTHIGLFKPWLTLGSSREPGMPARTFWDLNVLTVSFLALLAPFLSIAFLVRTRRRLEKVPGMSEIAPLARAAVVLFSLALAGGVLCFFFPVRMAEILFIVSGCLMLAAFILSIAGLIQITTSRGKYSGFGRCLATLILSGLLLLLIPGLLMAGSAPKPVVAVPAAPTVVQSRTTSPEFPSFLLADAWPDMKDLPAGIGNYMGGGGVFGQDRARVDEALRKAGLQNTLPEEGWRDVYSVRWLSFSTERGLLMGLQFKDTDSRMRWERTIPLTGMRWKDTGGPTLLWLSYTSTTWQPFQDLKTALPELVRAARERERARLR